MNDVHGMLIVTIAAAVTMLIRFLPFLIFGGERKMPEFLADLARMLPCALMGMLVVYCLKGVKPLNPPYGLPELIAGAAVAGLHLWKKNTFLSIGAGTALYMFLIQTVF